MKQIFIFFIAIFVLAGCQTYTLENEKMRHSLYEGNITSAITTWDNSSFSSSSTDYALFRMEKGMLYYLNKDYKSSVEFWQESDRKIDELYTTSISKTASTFLINDTMSDYSGESHERVLLPLFSSLAFFSNNDKNNSLVMIRKTYETINYLKDENPSSNIFNYDVFSHYYSGMVHESKEDWDNALVEYKAALNTVTNAEDGKTKINSRHVKNHILQTIGRLAEFRRRNDLLNMVKKEAHNIDWPKQSSMLKNGELYVIYESGRSPIKVATEFPVPTDRTILKISFPVYHDVPYRTKSANVYLNNKLMGKTLIMEDIGYTAKQALEERRVKDFVRMTARLIAKDVAARKLGDNNPLVGVAANIFNFATEVADTRSWTTLPDTLQVFRLPIEANTNATITIEPDNDKPISFQVKLAPGEKKLYRFRTFN